MDIPSEQFPEEKKCVITKKARHFCLAEKNPFIESRTSGLRWLEKQDKYRVRCKLQEGGGKRGEYKEYDEGESTERQAIGDIVLPPYDWYRDINTPGVIEDNREWMKNSPSPGKDATAQSIQWQPRSPSSPQQPISPKSPLLQHIYIQKLPKSQTPSPTLYQYKMHPLPGGKPSFPRSLGPPILIRKLLNNNHNHQNIISFVPDLEESESESEYYIQEFFTQLQGALKWKLSSGISKIHIPKCVPHMSKTVILDFDEILIYSPSSTIPSASPTSELLKTTNLFNFHFYLRPFALQFIRKLSEMAELILYSSADYTYLIDIINTLNMGKYFSYVLSRNNCFPFKGGMVKALQIINRSKGNTVILDDNIAVWPLDIANLFPISKFKGDLSDNELFTIYPQLCYMLNRKDLKQALKNKFKIRERLKKFKNIQKKKETEKRRQTIGVLPHGLKKLIENVKYNPHVLKY